MFELVSNMFTKGDISPLNNAMLHSSFWAQGGAKLYTPTQQNRCWLNWLAHTGMLSLQIIEKIECDNRTLVIAHAQAYTNGKVANEEYPDGFLMGVDIEHKNAKIKSISIDVDPVQLAKVLNLQLSSLQKWWPKSDPLMLSDFDHQIHPNTIHASPSLLLTNRKDSAYDNKQCLEKWWAIHQQGLLGDIFQCYSEDALITHSQHAKHLSLASYFTHLNQVLLKIERAYSQLVDIRVSGNTVFVKWRIEGDTGSGRIRQSFLSVLSISQGKITGQHTISS